jgi:hypothetical protein
MDAMIRSFLLYVALAVISQANLAAQQMNWSLLAEDTIYYGKDFLPDQHLGMFTGPAQIWDFRSLKAPYSISRRIIMSGERDNKTYANLVNGKQSDAIMLVSGRSSQVLQSIEQNPLCPGSRLTYNVVPSYKPFFHGVMGESNAYKGKFVSVFPWPRHLSCQWTPPQIPDSCRLTITMSEDIVVDGEGTLYLPTEVLQAYRQKVTVKKAYRVEVLYGLTWRDVTTQVPGIRLITNQEWIRFVTASTGLPVAEIELDPYDKPLSVEFKTHPLLTRVVEEEPSKPDIFAYPNPSYDIVRFQLTELNAGMYHLKIYNILGVQVREIKIEVDHCRETVAVDMSDLQRGTYLFRLQDKAGRTIKTKRVALIAS